MKVRSLQSKILIASLSIAAMLGNQACTDEEVLGTIGAVAIVGAVVSVGVAGGGGGGGGGYYDPNCPQSVQVTDTSGASISLSTALANKFNFSEISADRFVVALQAAKGGDSQELVSLGVNGQEAQLLASGQMMSEQGLQTLAKNLDQDPQDTKSMISAIMKGASTKKSALCQAALESSKSQTIPAICR